MKLLEVLVLHASTGYIILKDRFGLEFFLVLYMYNYKERNAKYCAHMDVRSAWYMT